MPSGVSLATAPGCSVFSAAELHCDGGTLVPGARVDFPIVLTWPPDAGTYAFETSLLAPVAMDPNPMNDTATWVAAVTSVGGFVVPMNAPRVLDGIDCFGTNITSFSQCTPPSFITDRLWPMPDGGVENDGGAESRWEQSASQRNLCMRFELPLGGTVFYGVSVSALCFEGGIDDFVTPQRNVGAFRVCAQ